MAKKFYFGTLYKVVFKVSTKYMIYIAYVECDTKEVKIYDTKEADHYASAPEPEAADRAEGGIAPTNTFAAEEYNPQSEDAVMQADVSQEGDQ
jgi:hypothetical protein